MMPMLNLRGATLRRRNVLATPHGDWRPALALAGWWLLVLALIGVGVAAVYVATSDFDSPHFGRPEHPIQPIPGDTSQLRPANSFQPLETQRDGETRRSISVFRETSRRFAIVGWCRRCGWNPFAVGQVARACGRDGTFPGAPSIHHAPSPACAGDAAILSITERDIAS